MSLLERIVACRAEARAMPEHEIAVDVVFVMHVSARGWILEKICRSIAAQGRASYRMIYSERNDVITALLPRARCYVFAHYGIYCQALARHPELHAARLFVWFTHPDFARGIGAEEAVFALRLAERIFTANAAHAALLGALGVPRSRLLTVYGGADPALFRPKRRGGGKVGFVGAYYERKSPDTILGIVQAMPEVEFLLLGPDASAVENQGLLWSNYPRARALWALPNLEIVETGYDHYPAHFARLDVYVSVATLEGGPIPLVEALMSNTLPVVTRTGFAEELVTDGVNGFLLPVGVTVEAACAAIRAALADPDTDVAQGTGALSWAGFGQRIAEAIRAPLEGRFSILPGADPTSRRCLRQGWRAPAEDGGGAWQFAPAAVVLLPLAAGARLRRLEIALEAAAPVRPEDRLALGVLLNGVALRAFDIAAGASLVLRLEELAPDLSRPGEDNVLELRFLGDPAALPSDSQGPRVLRLQRISGETAGAVAATGPAVVAPPPETGGVLAYAFGPGGNGRDLPGLGWRDGGAAGLVLEAEDGHLLLPVPDGGGGALRIELDVALPASPTPHRLALTDGLQALEVALPTEAGPASIVQPYRASRGARLLRLEAEGRGLALGAIRVAVPDQPAGSPGSA